MERTQEEKKMRIQIWAGLAESNFFGLRFITSNVSYAPTIYMKIEHVHVYVFARCFKERFFQRCRSFQREKINIDFFYVYEIFFS